jgi:hypothetical protein
VDHPEKPEQKFAGTFQQDLTSFDREFSRKYDIPKQFSIIIPKSHS